MPLKPEEFVEIMGVNLEEFEGRDQAIEYINKTYIPRAAAHKDEELLRSLTGRVNGSLRTKLKGVGKEMGVEAKWDEVDPTDGIDLIAARAKSREAELMGMLEEAKKGSKPAKEVEEIARKYDEARKLSDDLTGRLQEWEGKYKTLENSYAERERATRINAQWERAMGGIKFNEGVTPLAVKGFQAAVKEKFSVEFDAEGNPYAVDLSTKKRVANPNKAHEDLGLDELVRSYAEQEKLIGGNPQGGQPVRKTMGLLGGTAHNELPRPEGAPSQGGRVMPRVNAV